MIKYYTREGFEYAQRRVVAHEARVRDVGKEAGEEAGLNCDWHDNFGYEDAKRRLEMESTVLARMREDLAGAQIVEVEEQRDRVSIGTSVRVTLGETEKTVTIGAFGESAPDKGLVSYTSPLGNVLLGMRVGESKQANIAGKTVEAEVLDIFPPSHLYRELVETLLVA